MASVPLLNLENSNTPTGPFQMIVLLSRSLASNSSMVRGPMSIIYQLVGTLSTETVLDLASEANLSATTTSMGKRRGTPFSAAFSINNLAKPTLSSFSSFTDDWPTLYCKALRKVGLIPPAISRESTLSIIFSKIPILLFIFAPPMSAARGRSGSFRALSIIFISFSISKPATAGRYFATPTVEACALWAVPKASLT